MSDRPKTIGLHVSRYGLVIVLLWIGGMKFTDYEAPGVEPLMRNCPLMGWVDRFASVGGFSASLGVVEIAIGLLIAACPTWPLGSALCSGLAVGMFATTLSFLITTPGWEPSLRASPSLSAMQGQFVLKDVVLLGVALFNAGESLEATWPKSVHTAQYVLVDRRDAPVHDTTSSRVTAINFADPAQLDPWGRASSLHVW